MNIKVFTAFSGYDSQCMALDRITKEYPFFRYELVGWSEIDKFAIQAHNAVYPQWADRNFGDIAKIDWKTVPDFDLFTYSSPCQDFSILGRQRGGEKGSGTRSSLLWECQKAIELKRPRYLLMENVPALVGKKFVQTFNEWQLTLERLGYSNFVKILNAKDYGVPQNRTRIFLVSIYGEGQRYEFPKPFSLKRRLKDVLEQNVDDRYYLGQRQINYLIDEETIPQIISYTRDRQGKVLHYHAKDNGVSFDFRVQVTNTLHTSTGSGGNTDQYVLDTMGVRRLTERECFRLMDVDDADADKIQAVGISRSQQRKMAGNSIVVACLYHIFDSLFIHREKNDKILC